jgi:hypothetical protein
VLDAFNQEATFAVADLQAMSGSKATAFQTLDRYIADVGPRATDLKSAALQLKRRIAEGLPVRYAEAVEASRSGGVRTVTPTLVGRASELTALQDALSRARAGDPQCVVVSGEAGIGKTRLVSEFAAAAVIAGAHIERVTIQPHDGERPMGAFVDMVPALLRAPGALGCSPESMDALTNLTRQPSDEPSKERGAVGTEHHEARWTAVASAVVDLCEAIASESPLILVLDDVHWLDPSSMDVMVRMVRGRRKASILVVVTTREPKEFMRRMRFTERCCLLLPTVLDSTAAASLLDEVLGNEQQAPLSSLKTRIAAACGGNPLFLISVATHSRAGGDELRIPATVIESFGQRIDALTRPSVSVLAACAEFGKHATLERLSRALDIPRHTLVETLMELADAGLILQTEQSAIPAHPLVSDALSLRVPAPAKQAVAYTVAATLEADAAADSSPALWWDAAESWRRAGIAERAIQALRRCASHALDIGRPGEAARILDHAATLPQSAASLGEVSEALIRAADAVNDGLLVLRGASLLKTTVRESAHDDIELAGLRAAVRNNLSEEAVERLLVCASAQDVSPSHRVSADLALLKAADAFGSRDLRNRVISGASRADLERVEPLLRLEFELLVAATGDDWKLAASLANRILAECEDHPDHSSPRRQQNAAIALLYAGRVKESIAGYEAAYSAARKTGSISGQFQAAVQLASVQTEFGKEDQGKLWMSRSLALAEEAPHLAADFDLLLTKATCALLSDRLPDVDKAVSEAEGHGLFASDVRARWKRALDLALRMRRHNATASEEAIARTILSDRIRTVTGVREFEIGVACDALIMRGQTADAASAVEEYLATELRHFGPLSLPLARSIVSLGLEGRLGRRRLARRKRIVPHAAC